MAGASAISVGSTLFFVLIAGILVLGGGIAAMGQARTLWQIYLADALLAAGLALVGTLAVLAASTSGYFPVEGAQRRAPGSVAIGCRHVAATSHHRTPVSHALPPEAQRMKGKFRR